MEAQYDIPRVGMQATVRNRRGVIAAFESFERSVSGQNLHLVTIEFGDADGDAEESLLWERERDPVVLPPNALPQIDSEAPMRIEDFLALQRATRWGAQVPFLSAHSPTEWAESVPTAPLYGAVSADDFQLVPLASLKAAAGDWSDGQVLLVRIANEAEEWVMMPDQKLEQGMFVAQVVVRSMESEVPDGSYCHFRPVPGGALQGRRLLVWHEGVLDAETGAECTRKVYHTEKVGNESTDWQHQRITLNPKFDSINMQPDEEGKVIALAELVAVLRAINNEH